ncbi:hypothetical protein FRX31_032426 [Thalictrum thalictroides]|uniref:Uncharacterized protein n=1 Tax=Thalictrum thalictroides TaxID=46969 RepID=A0A7J6UZB4_THATH|nr:hypothetical protein FRX31_032426 [Thalictrum thalictroides]
MLLSSSGLVLSLNWKLPEASCPIKWSRFALLLTGERPKANLFALIRILALHDAVLGSISETPSVFPLKIVWQPYQGIELPEFFAEQRKLGRSRLISYAWNTLFIINQIVVHNSLASKSSPIMPLIWEAQICTFTGEVASGRSPVNNNANLDHSTGQETSGSSQFNDNTKPEEDSNMYHSPGHEFGYHSNSGSSSTASPRTQRDMLEPLSTVLETRPMPTVSEPMPTASEQMLPPGAEPFEPTDAEPSESVPTDSEPTESVPTVSEPMQPMPTASEQMLQTVGEPFEPTESKSRGAFAEITPENGNGH